MIRGVGVDLVHCPRVRRLLENADPSTLGRMFLPNEIAYCSAQPDPIPHYAGRLALKEATLKAFGMGVVSGAAWTDVEVSHDDCGRPVLILHGLLGALAVSRSLTALGSLSHDGEYALATVLLVPRREAHGA